MKTPQPKSSASIIFGVHPVLEALAAGKSVEKILIRDGSTHERLKEIRAQAKTLSIPCQTVPDPAFFRWVNDVNHQGVVALLAKLEYQSIEQVVIETIDRNENPLIVMLDGVTDVRNLGAIARSAEGLGAHALVVPVQGGAAINGDTIKTSAGALYHIPVCREAYLPDTLLMLRDYGMVSVGLTEKGSGTIFSQDLKQPLILVLGDEGKGISPPMLKRIDHLVTIPMLGRVESLNVSVAAGIALAETARQRLGLS